MPITHSQRMPTQTEIDAADRRAREWHFSGPGPLPIGSDGHRDAACRMFRDTFNPYKPSVIEWPKLDPEALHRLTSLPIWDIAVTTENKASARMRAYGDTAPDPAWREAIGRNGWEESRHSEVLANLVTSYGIPLGPGTARPAAGRPGMGLPGHRLLRVHRQLLRLRPVRSGPPLRLSSRRPWSTRSSR